MVTDTEGNPPRLSGSVPEWRGFFLRGFTMPSARMAVFIYYQNTYMRAREVFGDHSTLHDYTFGQVFPRRLAVLRGSAQKLLASEGSSPKFGSTGESRMRDDHPPGRRHVNDRSGSGTHRRA